MFGIYFLSNYFGYYISGMYINGVYGYDFLSIFFGELVNQYGDEGFELGYLFFVIIFQGIFIVFFQFGKCNVYFCGLLDLSVGQGYLWR